MARGVSVHVGINRVDVGAFSAQGLAGCENDAVRMSRIALSRNFRPADVRLLLGPEATFANVVAEIERAAAGPNRLVAGDIFLFTFAGHGSRIPDVAEEEALTGEPDGQDEALVLFDRLLLDDYLRRVLWPQFAAGVRIVGVTDSCHSASAVFALDGETAEHLLANTVGGLGAVASGATARVAGRPSPAHSRGRGARGAAKKSRPRLPDPVPAADDAVVEVGFRDRALTDDARRRHSNDFRPIYEELEIPSLAAAPPVRASLLTMAACEDGDTTRDGLPNGAFTTALLEVWADGAFSGTYDTFMERIRAIIAANFEGQVPVLSTEGEPAFSGQHPFSI